MIFAKPHSARPGFLNRWLRRLAWIGGGVLVLSVIVGLKAKNYIEESGGGEVAETKVKLKTIELLLASRKLLDGHYPSQDEGLEKLLPSSTPEKESDRTARRLKDGWQRKIRYRIPGEHHPESYDLSSLGPDGIEGTEDDITNW